MKQKIIAALFSVLLFSLFCAGTALADGEETLFAFPLSSDHLSLSEVTATYESGSSGHGDVGKLCFDMTVSGPEDVREVVGLILCGASDYQTIWTPETIAETGAEVAAESKEDTSWFVPAVPPFSRTEELRVAPELLGTGAYAIFFAFDENLDYVGYAVVFVWVPEDENAANVTVRSGTCGGEGDGSNVTWSLSGAGVLTISGKGAMADYDFDNLPEYRNYYPGDQIRSVVIEEGVTSIGAGAFYGCTGLSAVSLPEGLEKIGEEAFITCSSLTEVDIPDTVTKIGRRAFGWCTSLTELRLPDRAVTVGDHVFTECEALKQVVIPGGMESIGEYIFSNCGLEQVQLSYGVKTIGKGAFCYTKITSLEIPSSVVSIGDSAFRETSITSVSIPNSVAYVGSKAFYGCEDLTKVEIGCNGTVMGDTPFIFCPQLKSIYFSGTLAGAEGSWERFSCSWYSSDELIHYFPENVYYSGTDAQWLDFILQWRGCTGFSDRTVLHHLADGAVADSVIGLGFCGVDGDGRSIAWRLEPDGTLTVSGTGEMSSDTDWIYADRWMKQDDEQYVLTRSSSKLTVGRVVIGEGVTSVPANCFADTGAAEVSLPSTLTSLGAYCFQNTELTGVSLPDSLTSIGERCFASTKLTEARLPDSLTSMGARVFGGCVYLKRITMGTNLDPESVEVLAGSSVESLTFTYTADGRRTVPGNLFDSDFYNNRYKTPMSVNIPEGIVAVGDRAFAGCDGLTAISLPNSLRKIGDKAFRCCNGLTAVVIPEGVREIGADAFSSCENLVAVTVPNSVRTIGESCFQYCNNLHTVTMGLDAGRNRESTSYSFYQANYGYGEAPFAGCPVDTLVLNSGVTAPYSAGNSWNSSSDIANFSFVHHYFNYYYSSSTNVTAPIETVVLNEGIVGVGSSAFRELETLKALYFPKSVTAVSGNCVTNDTARSLDVYYAGSRYAWAQMMNYGHDADEPIFLATVHFGETYDYGSSPYGQVHTVCTASHTAPVPAGKTSLDFYGGIYSSSEKKPTRIDLDWSFDLFSENAILHVRELAIAALVLSENAERESSWLAESTLRTLGFEHTWADNYVGYGDDIDKVGYVIAVKEFKGQNIVAVVCRGSTVWDDWKSNLLHQAPGFGRAAENVLEGLKNFLGELEIAGSFDSSLPGKFFITGHSRGGAVANIVGKSISDTFGKSKTFVYTFACPNITMSEDRYNYANIANFVNTCDPVPKLPQPTTLFALPSEWYGANTGCNFKFGTYFPFTSDKDARSNYGRAFQNITGVSPGALDNLFVSCTADYPLGVRDHAPAAYMAYLLSNDDYQVLQDGTVKVLSVHCPVDIRIYDGSGHLLGTVTDNVPDEDLFANGVLVQVNGDEKEVCVVSGADLRLELVGTDAGEMEYTIREIDTGTGSVLNEKTFTHVALTDGKTMTSAVAEDIAVPDTQLLVRTEGEVTAAVAADGSETEVVLLSFDTDLGAPIRDMTVPKGGKAESLPTAEMDGFAFAGWYTDPLLTEPIDPETALDRPLTLYAAYTPKYDVYGSFSSVAYDGRALTAELEYEYNACASRLFTALYQNGQMLAIRAAEVDAGASGASVSIPISNLYGVYQLRAFTLDDSGAFLPISECAEVSFYAD